MMPTLPFEVRVLDLVPQADHRGGFLELFRESWLDLEVEQRPVQWNFVQSRSGTLRGVHVHLRHDDYFCVPSGTAVVGLCDLRESSPTFRTSSMLELCGDSPKALWIPHGVAHGFYFPVSTMHVYAVSHYFDPDDELGCRWDDQGLRIPWPVEEPALSARDESAQSLVELERQLAPHQNNALCLRARLMALPSKPSE